MESKTLYQQWSMNVNLKHTLQMLYDRKQGHWYEGDKK